jgi:hypothetical protein
MQPSGWTPRLFFCSYHCYLDPSSGAALATRDLLELLTGVGWPCGVFCGPHLDDEQAPSLERLLHDHLLPVDVRRGVRVRSGPFPPGTPPPTDHLTATSLQLGGFVEGGLPTTIQDVKLTRPG